MGAEVRLLSRNEAVMLPEVKRPYNPLSASKLSGGILTHDCTDASYVTPKHDLSAVQDASHASSDAAFPRLWTVTGVFQLWYLR